MAVDLVVFFGLVAFAGLIAVSSVVELTAESVRPQFAPRGQIVGLVQIEFEFVVLVVELVVVISMEQILACLLVHFIAVEPTVVERTVVVESIVVELVAVAFVELAAVELIAISAVVELVEPTVLVVVWAL